MRSILFIFSLLFSFPLFSQQVSVAEKYAATIDGNTIKEHVYKLASTEYEGRETGTDANLKAADYIADQFKSYSIPVVPGDNNHFQEVAFTSIKWSDVNMTVDGRPVEHLRDFLSIPQYFPLSNDKFEINALTFVGYGIDDPAYSDYKGIKFTGQHLLVYGGEPSIKNGNFRISGSDSMSIWSQDFTLKISAAKKAGAASIWIIEDHLREYVMYARRYLLSGSLMMGSAEQLTENFIPHVLISPVLGESLVGKKRAKVIKLRNRI